MMNQPVLFEPKPGDAENVVLFALGEFQARKKILAERELPLDRLRGAFKRACEVFEVEEFSDEKIADVLEKLGAQVRQVPSFVAKHPYKVTVQKELADRAFEFFRAGSEKSL